MHQPAPAGCCILLVLVYCLHYRSCLALPRNGKHFHLAAPKLNISLHATGLVLHTTMFFISAPFIRLLPAAAAASGCLLLPTL